MSRTHTPIPNDKLSRWHFAVSHAVHCIEMRIEASHERGFCSEYDQFQLEALEDLDMFLRMSWDVYMEELEEMCKEARTALNAFKEGEGNA
jgi:hypothetical protein